MSEDTCPVCGREYLETKSLNCASPYETAYVHQQSEVGPLRSFDDWCGVKE